MLVRPDVCEISGKHTNMDVFVPSSLSYVVVWKCIFADMVLLEISC